MKAPILVIEDDVSIATTYRVMLRATGREVRCVTDGAEGLRLARSGKFAAILTDLELPSVDGITLLRELRESGCETPVLLITGRGGVETAIQATRYGAYEYLEKPVDVAQLLVVISRILENPPTAHPKKPQEKPTKVAEVAMVGRSPAMQDVYKQIGRLAAFPVSVLIRGETGTGKELVARALHHYSERTTAAFVAVNCAAIPQGLIESELFGHEQGAFTGAQSTRRGRFEEATGGTLFLDEIGDLDLAAQAKLLRVLQERVVRRVGGGKDIAVDVRVVAATHRDLDDMMARGLFREDLYHRLESASVFLPPLRERREDIPLLAAHLLRRAGSELRATIPPLDEDCLDFLQNQAWHGNIRQLGNVLRKAVVESRGLPISIGLLKTILQKATYGATSERAAAVLNEMIKRLVQKSLEVADADNATGIRQHLIENLDRELILQALELQKDNRTRAAALIGISRVTLLEKLATYAPQNASDVRVSQASL